ncbi:MAG: prolipoprotein diacylglyceryl transferase [Actinobacteria bacterium]|nr:prolipoprotein diacylglyceryl transferase [Actinomycetota bacterium]
MSYHPIESVHLGPLDLHIWGLLVALGFLAGSLVTVRFGERWGLPRERLWTLSLIVLSAALFGSRLLWALQPSEVEKSLRDPVSFVAVWRPGLTLIGGLLAGLFAGVTYARLASLPLRVTVDAVGMGLGLGIAIGRIGCLLTGLHPGKPTSLPWAIDYLGAPRHPIPAYESLLGLGLLALALILARGRRRPGMLGITVVVGYLTGRSLLDLLRAAPATPGADPRLLGSLTLTQSLSLIAIPLLVALAFRLGSRVARAKGQST